MVTIVALLFAGVASWAVHRYIRQESVKIKKEGMQTVILAEAKLMPKEGNEQSGIMSFVVPKGHRAVTVGINEVAGVAGFIAPRNRVDVVFTTPAPGNRKNETITRIILQNVPVLATGQLTEQKDGKPQVSPTVTLNLTPGDAEILIHASRNGHLQLLLRNSMDTQLFDTHGTDINKFISSLDKPVPARTAPATPGSPRHTVTVIDGAVRTTKEFVLQ
jgi:pilus assembly protein CpaB